MVIGNTEINAIKSIPVIIGAAISHSGQLFAIARRLSDIDHNALTQADEFIGRQLEIFEIGSSDVDDVFGNCVRLFQ